MELIAGRFRSEFCSSISQRTDSEVLTYFRNLTWIERAALGGDHERLTYRYAGRDFRLTDVEGRVIEEVVA